MTRITSTTSANAGRRRSPSTLRWVACSTLLVAAGAVVVLGPGERREPVRARQRPAPTRVTERAAPPPNDTAPPIGTSASTGAVSPTPEPTLDERARSIVTDFDLAPETWNRMRSERPADLAREIASMRAALADLRGESDALHAGADRAVAEGSPQANAGVAGKLQPILQARRKLAAEMMIASLAKQARATEVP